MAEISYEEYQKNIQSMEPQSSCPVSGLIEILSGKWNLRVIFELTKNESVRFGELKRQIGNITNTSLSSALKGLEEVGLVSREQFNEIPPHVEYALTEKGRMLYPVFVEMGSWCKRYESRL